MNNLLDKVYWNSCYKKYSYRIESEEDKCVQFLKKYLPTAENGESCFEVGCCPCRFLSYIGKNLHYEMNGIDFSDEINDSLLKWIQKEEISCGKIEKQDFTVYVPERTYDVVYSVGFIEHFKNWEEMICRHDMYLKNGGVLIITTPNFRGLIQRCLHFTLDRKNYKNHYIPSMVPLKWADILKDLGYSIEFAGYFGGFEFWAKHTDSIFLKIVRFPIKIVNRMLKSNNKIPDCGLYSPYCGVVARKVKGGIDEGHI